MIKYNTGQLLSIKKQADRALEQEFMTPDWHQTIINLIDDCMEHEQQYTKNEW